MPAYFDQGFVVNTPAWHGLATVLTEAPDYETARVLAGHDWEPVLVPTFHRTRELVGVAPDGDPVFEDTYTEVENATMVERDDTHVVIGHGMSAGYTPLGNRVLWELLEAMAGEGATIETGGTLKGGTDVFATAYLDEPYTIPGDDSATLPYVAVTNNHGGTAKARAMATQVRIVCANTVQAAHLDSARRGTFFEFSHTANVMDRVAEAREAIKGVRHDRDEWIELASSLLGLKVDAQSYAAFVAEFIPEPAADIVSTRVRENIAAARAQFKKLYEGPQNGAQTGTALGLVNTAVEYLDHARAYRNDETRIRRSILRPEPLKARAVTIAREVCNA